LQALEFYTDFANPLKEVYCWNKDMGKSMELFAQGRLALMPGYSYYIPEIKALAPKLNFSVTKFPQIENTNAEVNFANYWVETVAAKSKHSAEAWDFIQFETKAENVKSYLSATHRPAALREMVDMQKDDKEIGVFAEELLTAKSWYKGKDAKAAEKIFAEMIDNTVKGQGKIEDIIRLAATKVQQTIE
jgi:ABC-type glycerol-3-phosphate transport system substrate-binding protein